MTGENVTREDFLFFKGQFERDQAALKDAQTQRKKTRQRAKLLGIDVETMDMALALTNENDDTSLNRFQTLARYTQYLNLPIGSQLSFLVDGDGAVSEDDYQKANREGFELGIQGKDPDDQAYPPLSPLGNEHRVGWNDGQRELKARFTALNEEQPEPERAPKPAKAAKAANGEKPVPKKRGRKSNAQKAAEAAAAAEAAQASYGAEAE